MTDAILLSILVAFIGIVAIVVVAPKKTDTRKPVYKKRNVYTNEHGIKPFPKNYEHL